MSTTSTSNTNIPYNQSEAIALGYAQYALMQTLTQQFRVNYPAAFLHAAAAAAATGYLPLSSSMMATASTNGIKTSTNDDFRLRRKPTPESDDNNNHIRVSSSINDQPYRRETYQTLLESSQILRPSSSQRPILMNLRKSFDTSMNFLLLFLLLKSIFFSFSLRSNSIEISLFIFIIIDISYWISTLSKSSKINF